MRLLAGLARSTATIRVGEVTLTPDQLLAAANAVADDLHGEPVVAVDATATAETVVAIVGAMLGGAAVVPVPPDSGPRERDHILREPLYAETKEEQEKLFNSGGAGGYAQPSQYVQVLAALLNDGKSPKNGAQILKAETVNLMWENQIPQHPDFGREGLTPAKAEMSNAAPEIYPQEGKLID